MTKNNAVPAPCVGVQKPETQLSSAEVVTAEILQGNFTSSADRDEFSQAIMMHGITFLYLANSRIPRPSSYDLNVMNKLGRLLSRFWPQALVIGGDHD
jgi:hypothetical protein